MVPKYHYNRFDSMKHSRLMFHGMIVRAHETSIVNCSKKWHEIISLAYHKLEGVDYDVLNDASSPEQFVYTFFGSRIF
jgi:hypothetical protein